MRVVSLWSGGKDSCFACYKAMQRGYEIISLFNFTNTNRIDSLSHGLSVQLIQKQVGMLNIPLLQKAMPKETYREEFKALISRWRAEKNIEGIIFGDIYLQEHKDWIDKICQELEIEAVIPLWGADTKRLIEEFIQAGFNAIVVAISTQFLGKEWLGRKLDSDFIEQLEDIGGIDFCGEKGEFHTFVYDGPIFKEPVEFSIGRKTFRDKRWFLELLPK